MAFIERFQTFVCEGDRIDTEVDGFLVTARIERDDCPDGPDLRQDGFWPSLYKDAPGFIGEAEKELVRGTNSPTNGNGWRERFDAAQARAEEIMRAWREDEWFYCGIVLSVSFEGVVLDSEVGQEKVQWTFSLPNAASLWGIEANYPESDNTYLTETAQDLLPDALAIGRASVARICAAMKPDAVQ